MSDTVWTGAPLTDRSAGRGPAAGVASTAPVKVGPQPATVDRNQDAAELAARIAQVSRGATRAGVLGVSDGLVTNVCLILAVAGANASASSVRLAGFASLLAGAVSMAAGEWVSVRSQVELYRGLLGQLQALVARDPELILDQLADHLVEAGFGRETALVASTELPLNESRFLRFTARTLFGIDPDELGSPMTAGVTSFVLFGLGALAPLSPWFFTQGAAGVALSVIIAVIASVVVGGYVSRSSGRTPVIGALRQLAIVTVSAAVTYSLGAIAGTAIG